MPMFLCVRNRAFSRQNIVCNTVSFKEVLNDKSIIHGMLFTSKLPKAIFRKMYSRYDAYYRCKYMQLEKCRDLNFSVLLDSYLGLSMKQALGLRPRASLSFLAMCIPDENANICGGSYALKSARLMHRILDNMLSLILANRFQINIKSTLNNRQSVILLGLLQ